MRQLVISDLQAALAQQRSNSGSCDNSLAGLPFTLRYYLVVIMLSGWNEWWIRLVNEVISNVISFPSEHFFH